MCRTCNLWMKGDTSVFIASLGAHTTHWCLPLGRETKDYEFGVEEKLIVIIQFIPTMSIVYQVHAFIFQLNEQTV